MTQPLQFAPPLVTAESIIPVAFDNFAINDGENYWAGFLNPAGSLPQLEAHMAARYGAHPLIGGISFLEQEILLLLRVLSTGVGSASDVLRSVFRGNDGSPKALLVQDGDGNNSRYVYALCTRFTQSAERGVFVATLKVHGDPVWISPEDDSATWEIAESEETIIVVNGSAPRNLDAYPRLEITPRGDKEAVTEAGRFIQVRWRSSSAATRYPIVCTLDTATLVSEDKMMASGDDLIVAIEGESADRFLVDMNTAATKIWFLADFEPARSFTLATDRTLGSTSDIIVVGDISGMPETGILLINDELFTYSARNSLAGTFSGVTPAAFNTTAAAHDATDEVHWIQNDIRITYGDPAALAPTPSSLNEPMFVLASSTNSSWVYQDFTTEAGGRPGAWAYVNSVQTQRYGGNQGAEADPFAELGIRVLYKSTWPYRGQGHWYLYNPCGISGGNFTNGQYYIQHSNSYTAQVRRSLNGSTWTTVYSLPGASENTWHSWSNNSSSFPTGTLYLGLYLDARTKSVGWSRVECSDCTVTLDSNFTPVVSVGEEGSNYRLQSRIINLTSGEEVLLDLASIEIDETVIIDAATSRVYRATDGSSLYRRVSKNTVRPHLFRLVPGANELQFVDEGTTDVLVEIFWRRRWIR